MGTRHARPQPKRLAEKLRTIRIALGYSLEEMAGALKGVKESPPAKSHISRFESGTREPNLLLLLEMSRVFGVSVESLIDDTLELPKKFKSGK